MTIQSGFKQLSDLLSKVKCYFIIIVLKSAMLCINPVDVKNVMKKIAEKGNKFQCEIFIFSYPGTEVVNFFHTQLSCTRNLSCS